MIYVYQYVKLDESLSQSEEFRLRYEKSPDTESFKIYSGYFGAKIYENISHIFQTLLFQGGLLVVYLILSMPKRNVSSKS